MLGFRGFVGCHYCYYCWVSICLRMEDGCHVGYFSSLLLVLVFLCSGCVLAWFALVVRSSNLDLNLDLDLGY